MPLIEFDETRLLRLLEDNYQVKRKTLTLAQPDLLEIAKANCDNPWGGQLNPAPGNAGDGTGTYLRSGEFVRTLDLQVFGRVLEFYSSATSYRKGYGSFAYGQALIDGSPPFKGAYDLLPQDFYD